MAQCEFPPCTKDVAPQPGCRSAQRPIVPFSHSIDEVGNSFLIHPDLAVPIMLDHTLADWHQDRRTRRRRTPPSVVPRSRLYGRSD